MNLVSSDFPLGVHSVSVLEPILALLKIYEFLVGEINIKTIKCRPPSQFSRKSWMINKLFILYGLN